MHLIAASAAFTLHTGKIDSFTSEIHKEWVEGEKFEVHIRSLIEKITDNEAEENDLLTLLSDWTFSILSMPEVWRVVERVACYLEKDFRISGQPAFNMAFDGIIGMSKVIPVWNYRLHTKWTDVVFYHI